MNIRVAKKILYLLPVLVVLLLLGTVIYFLFFPAYHGSEKPTLFLTVNPNDNASRVAAKLQMAGLISNQRFFIWSSRIMGLDRKFQAGRYKFKPGSSLWSILNELRKGEKARISVTIPEGHTVRQIAGLLQKEVGIDSAEFVSLSDSIRTVGSSDFKVNGAEGFLYPNTYNFYWRIDPEIVLHEMTREFQKELDTSLMNRAEQLGLTIPQVITLASLIEAETGHPYERRTIAAVFHRRLKIGMPLQCDPTVIYARGEIDRNLGRKDLTFDSPYNTYLYPGLPPGPINNPGQASILAALYPDTSGFLYFVARGDGTHIFSYDYDAHRLAISKVAREQRMRADMLKRAATMPVDLIGNDSARPGQLQNP